MPRSRKTRGDWQCFPSRRAQLSFRGSNFSKSRLYASSVREFAMCKETENGEYQVAKNGKKGVDGTTCSKCYLFSTSFRIQNAERKLSDAISALVKSCGEEIKVLKSGKRREKGGAQWTQLLSLAHAHSQASQTTA